MDKEIRNGSGLSLYSISIKTIVVHTVTYFVIGFISYSVFDYTAKFADPLLGNFMRPTDHPLVAAGPLFQVIRGFLFGLVFFWIRDFFFTRKNGWLPMWSMLFIVGILSPFGAAPSSIEGVLYSNVPTYFHLIGLPEITVQSFLLAFCTHYWVRHPGKKWISWLFGSAFALTVIFSILGILAATGILNVPTS